MTPDSPALVGRVLVPEPDLEVALAALADRPGITVVPYHPDFTRAPGPSAGAGPWPEVGRDAEVVVVWNDQADAVLAALPELPRLRMVQTLTSGVDKWRDRLPAGVLLANTRGAGGAATAEWALGAMLAMTRELPRFQLGQQAGQWRYAPSRTLIGAEVLIIGAGDVGTHLRDYLTALGTRTTTAARTRRPGVIALAEVDEVLPAMDAVVLAVPLAAETRRLVDATFLARMRKGALLVNAGRGPLVDTDALIAELRSQRLRAALDVTDPEPLPDGHPLWSCPGVLITPHVGTATPIESTRAWAVAAEQITALLGGHRPANLI